MGQIGPEIPASAKCHPEFRVKLSQGLCNVNQVSMQFLPKLLKKMIVKREF